MKSATSSPHACSHQAEDEIRADREIRGETVGDTTIGRWWSIRASTFEPVCSVTKSRALEVVVASFHADERDRRRDQRAHDEQGDRCEPPGTTRDRALVQHVG